MFESLNSMSLLAADHVAKPPLQFQVDTLLFSLLIFLGLLFVLVKFAWKPIMQGLDARETRIADEIENARLANEEAKKHLEQYEQKMAGATEEASAVLAQAREDAQATKDKILAEAKEEAQRERDRALAEIKSAKDAAVRDLAEKSVDSAVTLAGSIVGRSLDKSDHRKLIDQSIEKFSASGT